MPCIATPFVRNFLCAVYHSNRSWDSSVSIETMLWVGQFLVGVMKLRMHGAVPPLPRKS